jgi:hypothetical protein
VENQGAHVNLNRILSPSLNPTGLSAAAGVIYAAGVMIDHVIRHQGVFSAPVAVAGVAAVLALLTRFVVTPVADPKDGSGKPLVPVGPAVTAANFSVSPVSPVPQVTVTPPEQRQAF